MGLLLPGYEALAAQERARQTVEHGLDRLPWSPSFAAGKIHLLQTRSEAEVFVAQIRQGSASALGVDTEFANDRAAIELPNGQEFTDYSSIRPQVCSVVAWCDAGASSTTAGRDLLIRGVFDLRRPEVLPALRDLFSLGLPWMSHAASAELHCLWACGVEPPEHLLIDTYLTAACLVNGRFHRRNACRSVSDDIANQQELETKAAHITSLVGQCEQYSIPHPFAAAKELMRERFLHLRPDDPLDESMLAYSVSDAEYALRLYFAQQPDVDRFGLSPHLSRVEFPFVATLARMEWTGLPFDAQRAAEYREMCKKIVVVMGDRLQKHGVKPGSRDSFLVVMSKAGLLHHFELDGKYSTKREVLLRCEELGIHPAVRLFRLHRHFDRTASTLGVLPRLVSDDGRLRCSLRQLRSASGRVASVRPNMIGLDGRLRPVIAPTAGSSVLIELDYSQIEVGLAGAVWGDEALVRLFNTEDAYAAIAQSFFQDQISAEERALSPADFKARRPDLRDQCKALMLGALYGLEAESLGRKLKCSTEQAAGELERFFGQFPKAAAGARAAVEAALRNGYGVTATGFRRFIRVGDRRLRRAMRNHPVQGVAAATFKVAIARIDRHFRGTDTKLLLPRHDSILIETPTDSRDRVVAACELFMTQAVREVFPQLQPRVESKTANSWPTKQTLEGFYRREINSGERDARADSNDPKVRELVEK